MNPLIMRVLGLNDLINFVRFYRGGMAIMRKKLQKTQYFGIAFLFISLMLAACSQDTPPPATEVESEEYQNAAIEQIDEGAAIRAVGLLET